MENSIETSENYNFYKQLFKKVLLTAIVGIAISLSYTLWVVGADSNSLFLPVIIIGLALVKSIFIVRLKKMIK